MARTVAIGVKKYAAILETRCSPERIRIYGVAFKGKEVLIDGGYIKKYKDSGCGKS